MTQIPDPLRRAVKTFRQPEYTGENRCIPCTISNVAITGLLSAGIWFLSKPAAVVVFMIALVLIYFRGYLVPGTPTLTARYFPEWVLARFDSHEIASSEPVLEPETVLREAGLITTCERADDVCLAEDVREEWHNRIHNVDAVESKQAIADVLGVDTERLSFRGHDPAVIVEYDGQKVGQWESRAARTADVASSHLLSEQYDGWKSLTVTERSQLLRVFRIFLERCPACGGSVSIGQDVVESCCRSFDVVASTCDTCDARLLEQEIQSTTSS